METLTLGLDIRWSSGRRKIEVVWPILRTSLNGNDFQHHYPQLGGPEKLLDRKAQASGMGSDPNLLIPQHAHSMLEK